MFSFMFTDAGVCAMPWKIFVEFIVTFVAMADKQSRFDRIGLSSIE